MSSHHSHPHQTYLQCTQPNHTPPCSLFKLVLLGCASPSATECVTDVCVSGTMHTLDTNADTNARTHACVLDAYPHAPQCSSVCVYVVQPWQQQHSRR